MLENVNHVLIPVNVGFGFMLDRGYPGVMYSLCVCVSLHPLFLSLFLTLSFPLCLWTPGVSKELTPKAYSHSTQSLRHNIYPQFIGL